MTLPEIVLPKIVLPFDVPVLLHPVVDHFLIALPVVILLLELMNLMMKKKAVGGVSFFLLVLTVLAATAAYFTGLADGKEAYPALADAAKTALAEHKLLGTYILLGSGVVLFFKLLAMTGNKALKALYILVLIAFVIALFKQGKEGGELVYEHGLNVEQVKTLDDEIFDLKDALEDALAEAKKSTPAPVVPQVEKAPAQAVEVAPVSVEKTPAPKTEVVTPSAVASSPMESTGVETIPSPTQEATMQNVAPAEAKATVIPSENEMPAPQ
ncbi:MAG: DUF2231 domain-containing protein [Epsilonproteobacteria bacterium]|nr:DUF2231 domain-containing protein [Campylobacterota bacterium]